MTADLSSARWARYWTLNQKPFLNHGSFGATPNEILDLKDMIARAIDHDREDFLWFEGEARLERERKAIAAFVNVPESDLVLIDHVTEGFNSVMKSLAFKPGDEILITNHIYSLYKPILNEIADRSGAKIVTAYLPYRGITPDSGLQGILASATPRTVLAFIDHITSPTAIIFPIKEIVAELQKRGIDTFVDGAHAPGQVALDVQDIGAAYYTANNHKWLCAPVSSGFLYVRPDRQKAIVPAVGSWYDINNSSLVERFAWQGTRDLSARLCLSATLDYMAKLHEGGWPGIMKRNHELAVAARSLLARELNTQEPCVDDMIGCFFTLPLSKDILPFPAEDPDAIKKTKKLMRDRFGYLIHLCAHDGELLLRASSFLHNGIEDYERLAGDLKGFFIHE